MSTHEPLVEDFESDIIGDQCYMPGTFRTENGSAAGVREIRDKRPMRERGARQIKLDPLQIAFEAEKPASQPMQLEPSLRKAKLIAWSIAGVVLGSMAYFAIKKMMRDKSGQTAGTIVRARRWNPRCA